MAAPETVKDLLFAVYGKKKTEPALSAVAKESLPDAAQEAPPAPIPAPRSRSVGDVTISMQAQGIYSPDAPPAPPKPPSTAQTDRGTVGAMDASSKWDKGNK